MTNKISQEWKIDAPWGKLALISWGERSNPPILLVHGHVDTAATFIPLLEHLPDSYYYVGVDFPGNGQSDPFPAGPVVNNGHMVEVIRRVVTHMKWNTFVYMSHSLGFTIGTYYNMAFPGKISKIINIDPVPTLAIFYYATHRPDVWIQFYYNIYYENYKRFNTGTTKLYTYENAVETIAKNRHLSADQAKTIISRMLVPVKNNLYRFSSAKYAGLLVDKNSLLKFLESSPPTLNIKSKYPGFPTAGFRDDGGKSGEFALEIDEIFRKSQKNLTEAFVDGQHDFHITHAAEVAPHVTRFLNKSVSKHTAKL